jgi:hypothetical protein
MAAPSCLPPVPQREKDNLPWLKKASGTQAGTAAILETENNHIKIPTGGFP